MTICLRFDNNLATMARRCPSDLVPGVPDKAHLEPIWSNLGLIWYPACNNYSQIVGDTVQLSRF